MITTYAVESTGPGRPDYSSSIDVVSAPVVRRHQKRTVYTLRDYFPVVPVGDFIVSPALPLFYENLQSAFDIRCDINPAVIATFWFGVFDWFELMADPTVNGLINATKFGPFMKQYSYGDVNFTFTSPVSYIESLDHPYRYWYLFIQPHHDEVTDMYVSYEWTAMRDKYV
ncbi:MAG: hypothetical protein PHU95_03515 [Candidatus Thermoplasmatota archaeon]|nr:hypothetical protein [Candidatus Thermoplasmatota archaeon]